ncbi:MULTISPECIES: cytochrome o ubiquinol oxidase subunit IV [Pseudomonas]|uniref:Cytochrome bo(3) ubiquinol oxidase subunit 4 n=1 Tax=Pseudomonas putida TaxID=303 RepID=A0A177SCZ7_PSEPU|nr:MULTISPECIES: cytochrome o ubiquinol oxidase subunit IV [Pseudomonas]MDG9883777.1 cytochrome o ubiquinol oxidase subunit IV [Pseudomonas sp. GD04058]OAI86149.1 cytochrome o ubiquinol oxidase subunit IV [Pseudomonas putida]
MSSESQVHSSAGASQSSARSYNIGFLLAAILTLVPFALALYPSMSRRVTFAVILGCAVLQILVHVVFFLHLTTAREQRWSLVALVFSVVIIALLVGLSLWIMYYVHANMLGL